jgi:Recombinase
MALIPVPYGLRVASDCIHLEEHPDEKLTLMLIMDLIVDDKPLSEIAISLNARGLRTRAGNDWTPVAIFNLLPRTVDAGPHMFTSSAWVEHRQARAHHFGKPS